MTIEALLGDARLRMGHSVDSTSSQFASVHTGAATPALLDRVTEGFSCP